MRVWVTGYGGFIGNHLIERLRSGEKEIFATYFRPAQGNIDAHAGFKIAECDIRDRKNVFNLLSDFKPEIIFHLAAQSYPTISWEDPWYTIETNVIGTINIFEGVKEIGLECIILNACSSAQYGFVTKEEVPVIESHSFKPLHPYGVSKVAQEMLGYQYYKNFGIKSVAVRIFNTTGPGKFNDVCSDFTRRLIEIEKGHNPNKELRVGNLKAKRAIADVRDIIRALIFAVEKATVGETYNLSGEAVYSIQEIVEMLQGLVDFRFIIREDNRLLRPTDEPVIYGSSDKFRLETGWRQEIELCDTLRDMLNYWRKTL